MKRVRDHLGLVFHRFTASAMPPLTKPLALHINGAAVARIDPFLTHHRGTQRGQQERVKVEDAWVTVQPYTLPYISKLEAPTGRRRRSPVRCATHRASTSIGPVDWFCGALGSGSSHGTSWASSRACRSIYPIRWITSGP